METILLVEDKAELREMLATALARMEYEVTPAANLAEALAALRRRRFSAVLTGWGGKGSSRSVPLPIALP